MVLLHLTLAASTMGVKADTILLRFDNLNPGAIATWHSTTAYKLAPFPTTLTSTAFVEFFFPS